MTDKKCDEKKAHEGQANTMPYPASRLTPAIDLVDLAKEIDQADTMVNSRVNAQLQVIADQIKTLQDQARDILSSAQKDQYLHRAKCSFKRIPGKTYHLYEKESGEVYFSLLAPSDWGGGLTPHRFMGSYRLEVDMSWTELGEEERKNNPAHMVKNLLDL